MNFGITMIIGIVKTAAPSCRMRMARLSYMPRLVNRGPLVLEGNSSPGLEGIEKASGIDVADKIIEYLEDEYGNRDRYKPIDI